MAYYIALGIGGLGATIGSYNALHTQRLQSSMQKLEEENSQLNTKQQKLIKEIEDLKTENASLKEEAGKSTTGKVINEVLETPFTLKQVAKGGMAIATGTVSAIPKLIGLKD